ncbi:hypothetical protein F5887DRAFT_1076642 [Amanita rubescens]|nr:hypothetical protein F5887DRAFT_1076642 [Amanita rubescens]
MAPGGSKKPPLDIPRETNPRESLNLAIEETSSLLLPEKERRYRSSRKRMKTKYYELEARSEQIRNEVQLNFSSTLSRELEIISSTLKSWRKVFPAHKREHYLQCSQLRSDHATEFDVFIATYLKSHFRLNEHSRVVQLNFRNAYLCLHNGSYASDTLPKPFLKLAEIWDSRVRIQLTHDLTHSDSQPPTQDPGNKLSPLLATAETTRKSPGVISKTTVDKRERVRSASTPTRPVSTPSRTTLLPMEDKPRPSTVPRKHDSPRVKYDAGKRDSALESPDTPRRVQVTRTQERPSSLKPDLTPASRELQRNSPSKPNEPAIARGLDSRGKLPSESSKKTELSVSHTPSRKSNTRDKRIPPPMLEPSVFVRKLPDKSTRVVGSSSKYQVVAAVARCAPIPRAESKSKSRIGYKLVSTKEQESAVKYAPSTETALSLSESLPVTSIRANPSAQLKHELTLAPSWLPKRCDRVVTTKSAISEPPAVREVVQLEQIIEVEGSSPLLPEISNEHIPARSPDALGFVSAPGYISSFSGEMGEKRQVCDAVVSIQNVESEEVSSLVPEDSTSLVPSSVASTVPAFPTAPARAPSNGLILPPFEVVPVLRCSLNIVSIHNNEDEEVSSPALPARNMPTRQSPDEASPPAEVVSRRCSLNIVNIYDNVDEEVRSSPVPPTRGTSPRRSPKVTTPIEVLPRQRNYDIVSTHRGSEEASSTDDVAVPTLSAPNPVILPVLSVQAEPSGEPADEDESSAKVVSQQYDPNIVSSSKPSRVSKVYSPYPRTARKQSELLKTPSEVSEGRPHVKAVVHVQERTVRRSSILNDSVCRIPKVLPSRTVATVSESKSRIGDTAVSTRKLASRTEYMPFAKETSLVPKPSPVSPTPAIPSSQLQNELIRSPPRVSKRREVHVTNKKLVVSKVTHQKNEVRSRVPEPALNVRAGKNLLAPSARKPQQLKRTVEVERNAPAPLETSKESVIERSTSIPGPSNIRVQSSLLSIELGEKRRIYDTTVVNIQHISEEMSSPNASVASMPSVPAPATSSVQAEAPRHPLDEDRPPIEAVSRQHGLNVVNDRTTVSKVYSRNSQTVRRQSNPNNYPSEVSEGRHLASAAAYVQERKRRRSLDYDGNVRRASKGPPDKSEAEFASLRQALSVIRKETEASVDSCSPRLEPEEPESSPVQPKAAPQQLYVPRAIGLSTTCSNPVSHHPESTLGISHVEVSESRAERLPESVNVKERVEDTPQDLALSNEEETRLRGPYVFNNEEMSSNLHSPGPCMALAPLTHMATLPTQAVSPHQLKDISFESHQLVQHPTQLGCVPDCLDSSQRQILDILNSALRQLVGSSKQSSNELDWSFSLRRYPCNVISQLFNPSAAAYSPQPVVVLTPPILKRASQVVAFDLGCSLGTSLRMMWVFSAITFRAIHNREAEETEYTIIHEDDKTPTSAPPSYPYVDAKAAANAPPSLPPEPSWWAETPDSTCVKRIWRTRHKPPDVAVNYRRQNYSVVNKTNFMSEHHSHLHWAETMPPKSMNFVLGNDPGPEAETTTESGHSLTHERCAESPRCQYSRSCRSVLASP